MYEFDWRTELASINVNPYVSQSRIVARLVGGKSCDRIRYSLVRRRGQRGRVFWELARVNPTTNGMVDPSGAYIENTQVTLSGGSEHGAQC